VELETIQTLISHGIVTITTGGGGIPVIDPGDGNYRGVAAVIDKDYASSLLARALKVDLFVISTAVEKVALYYGTPQQRWLDRLTCVEAKNLLAEGIHFAKGSMAPKIQSIIWYLEAVPQGRALITNPENLGRALKGETGTWFVP
jgi:carbamate kinase